MVGVGHVTVCLATSSPQSLNRSQSAIGRVRQRSIYTPKGAKRPTRRAIATLMSPGMVSRPTGSAGHTVEPSGWDPRITIPHVDPRSHSWVQQPVPDTIRARAIQTPSETVYWAGQPHDPPPDSCRTTSSSRLLQHEFDKLSEQFEQLQERYTQLDSGAQRCVHTLAAAPPLHRPGSRGGSSSSSRPASSWGRTNAEEAKQLGTIREALCHRTRMSAFAEKVVRQSPFAIGKTFAADVPGIRLESGNFAKTSEPGIMAHHARWRHQRLGSRSGTGTRSTHRSTHRSSIS